MKKNKAIKDLRQFANDYTNNLLGKKLLFIFSDFPRLDYLQVIFRKNNFRHMTGVETSLSPSLFYDACIDGKLSEKDFDFSNDGTTQLKFQVMMEILNVHITGRYIGEYNGKRPYLITDKFVGNYNYCLGLKKNKKYYSPNTVLKANITKEILLPPKEIWATLRTDVENVVYDQLCYMRKNTSLSDIILPDELLEKIDPSLLV